mmetsp:Transcript_18498/g.45407  ORF Transcript_18498/g.45407 Transcript_18498/m.45407 type:complete len:477 (+) Transcript_18498:36-1466(+)
MRERLTTAEEKDRRLSTCRCWVSEERLLVVSLVTTVMIWFAVEVGTLNASPMTAATYVSSQWTATVARIIDAEKSYLKGNTETYGTPKKAFIHIGTHKTSTTTIQFLICKAYTRNLLNLNNFTLPIPKRCGTCRDKMFSDVAEIIMLNTTTPESIKHQVPKFGWCTPERGDSILEQFFDGIADSSALSRNLIFSSERFSKLNGSGVLFLREALEKYGYRRENTRIIIYHRKIDSYIRSMFQQMRIRDNPFEAIFELTEDAFFPHGNISRLVENYGSVFGYKNLKLISYDNLVASNSSVGRHFFQHVLGIDPIKLNVIEDVLRYSLNKASIPLELHLLWSFVENTASLTRGKLPLFPITWKYNPNARDSANCLLRAMPTLKRNLGRLWRCTTLTNFAIAYETKLFKFLVDAGVELVNYNLHKENGGIETLVKSKPERLCRVHQYKWLGLSKKNRQSFISNAMEIASKCKLSARDETR